MSYDAYLHEKTSETRDTVKRFKEEFDDRRDAEDRERTRRYISFLKADRETMLAFDWNKEGAQFLPQIIHDLCEVEAFLKICQYTISRRPWIRFTDLVELFVSVCKDYLALAEDRKGHYDYSIVEDFIKEWEES